jgi:hypothetical protein
MRLMSPSPQVRVGLVTVFAMFFTWPIRLKGPLQNGFGGIPSSSTYRMLFAFV